MFRLKKASRKENTSFNLFKKNLSYFTVVSLSLILIIANFQNRNKVSAAPEQKAAKTIVAHLVKNEFSLIADEELIEEYYTPDKLKTVGQEKYSQNVALIDKRQSNTINEESIAERNVITIINDEGMAIKPKFLNQTTTSELSLVTKRSEIVYYTVQKGDAVSTIARRFGVTVNTILWANNLTASSLIRPGDTLTILPESGILHTVKSGDTISKIARTYDVEEEKILSSNQLGATLKIGDKIMVPGGRRITVAAATPRPTTPAASNTTGLGIIRDLVKAPDSPVAATTEGMLWPTEGRRITQYYSWRHTGLDIANKTGTPLYASEAGTVEFAGWSNGYGYNVVIDHGGGKKTRYAHASQMFVKAGDTVTRGEHIAAMGSTGWSTGPHIHFEVIINGVKQNPLNYIK